MKISISKYPFPLLIVLAVVFTYFNALGYDFVRWDDFDKVVNNPLIKVAGTPEGLKSIFTLGSYGAFQPVTNLTYALDYQLWGMNPAGYHFANIVLFILGCLALEKFLSRFCINCPWMSCLVLLLAVHPIHSEMVTWISGRKDVLGFLFLSLSLLTYQNTMKAKAHHTVMYLGPLICFVLAVFSKSNYMLILVLFFAMDLKNENWSLGKLWKNILSSRKIVFYIMLIVISYINIFYTHLNFKESFTILNQSQDLSSGVVQFFQVVCLSHADFLCLLPMSPVHFIDELTQKLYFNESVIGFLIVIFYVCLALVGMKRKKQYVFWVLWIFAGYIPLLYFVATGANMIYASRYMYISNIGFFGLLACGTGRYLYGLFSKFRAVFTGLFVVLLLILGLRTHLMNSYWADSMTLWQRVSKFYSNSVVNMNLGGLNYERGNIQTARSYLMAAFQKDPHNDTILYNLGLCYHALDENIKAEEMFLKAKRLNVHNIKTRIALIELYLEMNLVEKSALETEALLDVVSFEDQLEKIFLRIGRAYFDHQLYDIAENLFREAMEVNPHEHEPRFFLMEIYMARGNPAAARSQMNKILDQSGSIVPRDVALNRIGRIYFKFKSYDLAAQCFEEAYNSNPNETGYLKNLGHAHFSNGNFEEAKVIYLDLLQEKGDDAQVLNNLGYVYLQNGKKKIA
ncbi:tetratricopeptide repeat protein, partial [PVC group bacterium]|nr:tetratricopeptide repeat protein [PVC group bacterium]